MKKYLSFIAVAFLLAGCKPDAELRPNNATVNLNAKFGTADLIKDTIYTLSNGQRIKPQVVKMYLSNITGIKTDGTEVAIKDVAFFDFTNNTFSFKNTLADGNYKALKFGIGLNPVQNATDPSTIADTTNPLHLNYGMWWTAGLKYVFTRFEAKTDTTTNASGSSFGWYILYHIGLDENYKMVTLTKDFTINKDANTITISCDYKTLFDGSGALNIITDKSTHSGSAEKPITDKVAALYQQAFSFEVK